MKEIIIPIDSIKCQSCKATIEKKLPLFDGIETVHVSLVDKQARIQYDQEKINIDKIIEYINQLGYKATLPKEDVDIDQVTISVDGMKCQSCKATIEKKLPLLDGIETVHVSLVDKQAYIGYNKSIVKPQNILKYIQNMGYSSSLLEPVEEYSHSNHQHEHIRLKTSFFSDFTGFLVVLNFIFAMLVMVLSMSKSTFFNGWSQFFLTSFVIVTNWNMISAGYRGLKNFHPNMYSLIFLGVLSGYLYSFGLLIYQIVYPQMHIMFFFDAAAAVLSFVAIGEYLQAKGNERVKRNLGEIKNDLPSSVAIMSNGSTHSCLLSSVEVGDYILVKPGEMIPLDGILKEGTAQVVETLLTGEVNPINKQAGEILTSGTYLGNNSIILEVTHTLKNSFFYKVKSSLNDIEQNKTPILDLVDKISYYFVPTVILLCIISFAFWGIYNGDWVFALKIAITVLVVACPCALGLATPLAVMVFFGTAFKEGFLLKNSRILSMSKLDTAVLDKTGTITSGHFSIVEWGIEHNQELDALIYSLQSRSNHPYANSVSHYLAQNYAPKPLDVQDFQIHPGAGVQGNIDGTIVMIGNHTIIDLDEDQKQIQNLATHLGKTVFWVSINQVNKGYILIEDTLRKGVKDFITFAKAEKYSIEILSGDNTASVEFLAKQLNILNFKGNVTPFDKLERVKELQKEGHKVFMIGDGLNDSLVLAQSDLSLTLGNGRDLASASGDIVAINEDLADMVTLIKLGKKTNRIIAQNLFWAFIYNIITLPWAMGIFYYFGGALLNPMVAAFSMAMSSILVVLNSLRLIRFKA